MHKYRLKKQDVSSIVVESPSWYSNGHWAIRKGRVVIDYDLPKGIRKITDDRIDCLIPDNAQLKQYEDTKVVFAAGDSTNNRADTVLFQASDGQIIGIKRYCVKLFKLYLVYGDSKTITDEDRSIVVAQSNLSTFQYPLCSYIIEGKGKVR